MKFRVIIMDYGCIDYLLYLKLKNYFSYKKGVDEIFLFFTSNLVKWSQQIKPCMNYHIRIFTYFAHVNIPSNYLENINHFLNFRYLELYVLSRNLLKTRRIVQYFISTQLEKCINNVHTSTAWQILLF